MDLTNFGIKEDLSARKIIRAMRKKAMSELSTICEIGGVFGGIRK